MESLHQRMKSANALLAPFAVPHAGTLGRRESEPDDPTRFPFQRDRDRIIHTQAFRRLQGKTQVFVAGEENDHVRTRLTHTMEVAQIGRDIARTLKVNEDLTECIALAHDLGHPPFGHRGEEALHEWARSNGFSFEHNEQSLRIVSVLEVHSPLQKGLNLNSEILEGLQKHRRAGASHTLPRAMTIEAQIVNRADEIAYLGHDFDDGLHSKLFPLGVALSVPLIAKAHERAEARKTSLRGALIHLLVSNLYDETSRLLEEHSIRTLSDVHACSAELVAFSRPMDVELLKLRAFLQEHMYAHPRVTKPGIEGQRIIRLLCEHYLQSPNDKIVALRKQTGSSAPEAVKDYVAGMTDAFARTQAEKEHLL
jgi:dGTPase